MRRSFETGTVIALAMLLGGLARAALPVSTDITVQIHGTTVTDDEVVDEYPSGVPHLADLGGVPASAEVDGYWPADDGDHLFSLDTTVELPGSVVARPSDVVRWDGFSHTIEFDALGLGLPDGTNVDAVMEWSGFIVVSFDTSVDLGNGVVAADEDLVTTSGGLSIFLDASAAGIDPALDLDAAALADSGAILLSFDQAGSVGGVDFDDDTVLAYLAPNWSIAFDASVADPGFETADVVAVPEPSATLGMLSGFAFLTMLCRRRSL